MHRHVGRYTMWLFSAALVACGVAVVVLGWPVSLRDKQTDPQTDPEAAAVAVHGTTADYVGVDRCAECHPGQAEKFAASGHARTFRLTDSPDFAFLAGRRHVDSDRGIAFQYAQDGSGLSASLPQVFPGRQFPLTFALGSGTHAITFLTLVPNQHGETVGIEHRVSVFGDGTLARTPGATAREPVQPVEHFGEIHEGERLQQCVHCHTTTAEIAEFEIRNLRPHVQCERCHGPGSEHVAAMDSGTSLTKLAFAPGTATARAEIEMCGRCHRLPEMLSDTPLDRTHAALTRYQPVGMLQSACYRESNGQLRCTTCHDPHERADLRPRAAYEQTCIRCHQEAHAPECPQASAAPSAPDCIDCHMPRVEVHPGISFHDHWIRVRDDRDPAPSGGR